ncbi:superoxide dismutase [Cu-Zn] SodC2 [Pseudomethylobacillus aquaticus]|uniref:Superoxide dismutase [Cu-Zn] n=1 Tax=Pseudomethylobacillus aquaticus TaxID=2676064 RepID=A0A3N0V6U5_9PROT|nr:superoxide dismutase family protein [Pseudomethylobacillus aquaticus]ROH88342.1 superoxide dismutase [Cu-Zn] SodC2 [Pseudomethylobacillus aquaticus]
MQIRTLLLAALISTPMMSLAAEKIVVINAISDSGIGPIIGVIKFSDSDKGLIVDPDIGTLTPGEHGFHIHEKPNCGVAEKDGKKVAGLAAGGHFDPAKSSKHEGPEGHGHHGDLPALQVNEDGSATRAMLAPRLKLADVTGRAIMIHEGGDNYSDDPKPLGGGGARVACGVIE